MAHLLLPASHPGERAVSAVYQGDDMRFGSISDVVTQQVELGQGERVATSG